MSDYTPSAEAVEVVARALWVRVKNTGIAADLGGTEEMWSEWTGNTAHAVLVALMGATVTEPCANPKCDHGTVWLYEGHGDPCPDCPAPRSLAVRECETAGRLERRGVIPAHYDGVLDVDVPAEPLFREVAPSTGREPR